MSATLNTELFLDYFPGSVHVQVPGRMYPVKETYLEDMLLDMDYKFPNKKKFPRIDTFQPNIAAENLENDSEETLSEEIGEDFDTVIEVAFRYGDFEDIFELMQRSPEFVNYQVRK